MFRIWYGFKNNPDNLTYLESGMDSKINQNWIFAYCPTTEM